MRDCVFYIALRAVVLFMRLLPLGVWLFLARPAGWVYSLLAFKKNRLAYKHLRQALGERPRKELLRTLRCMHVRFAQNLAETLYMPQMGSDYIAKHVHISNAHLVEEAKKSKQSVIFMGVHAGSWELSNAACAQLFEAGSYAMLAQPQVKHKKLDTYLNSLRRKNGVDVIRVDELKVLLQHLSQGKALGTIADHGGQDGVPIEFFGKLAMTPVGGLRLAKKMNARLLLAFMRRIQKGEHEVLLEPYELVVTQDAAEDLKVNLRSINKIYENWIRRYPEEYLWTYKRWKYSPQKNVLVLSDGKAGHFKQSQALAEMLSLLGYEVKVATAEVGYRNKISSRILAVIDFLFGKRACLFCLRWFLKPDVYKQFQTGVYDLVVSCGSSLAAVNQALAFYNNARSIAVMKPGILPLSRFDLVVLPEHDNFSRRKNVVQILGSLNMVSPDSIKGEFRKLLKERKDLQYLATENRPRVGLLIGGDSKNYELTVSMTDFLCSQVKKFLDEAHGHLFLTTSRRTPPAVVEVLKAYFGNHPACKLFVVAAEHNPEGTVGGIFYLSDRLIVSGESISMVSEAAASGKPVLVFEPRQRTEAGKVRNFLGSLSQKGYIFLINPNDVYDALLKIGAGAIPLKALDVSCGVCQALKMVV